MKADRQQGRSAFDLFEEATHLLRTAPAVTLAVYYAGAIPFVLGLLFFWADMSRSPLAPQHLAGGSLGLALLFFWMKLWQADFAQRVRAQAAREKYLPLSFRRAARILFMQAIVHPAGLFLLPLALLPVLPFPWVYALFQNVTALDDGSEAGTGALLKKSWRQAKLWPRQNHAFLALGFVFLFCVFLNWVSVCLVLPQVFKMLFGVESDFTRSPWAMLNSTFFAAMLAVTYLSVDPILKAAYALRCFYGDSLESGEDLKAELKPFINGAIKTAAALLAVSAFFFATPARAATTNAPPVLQTAPAVPPSDLDHAINQTVHERKYLWRMPREAVVEPETDRGIIGKFFDKLGQLLRDWVNDFGDWLQKILRKLFPHSRPVEPAAQGSGYGWIIAVEILIYALAIAAVAALLYLLWRVWRNRRPRSAPVATEPIQPAPDLADENVRADQLPEDGWTKLARELLERGEFRLAMRAFYLASLAHLAAHNLISIARCKS
ncbi:MAG TPA: hypothetical protein VF988_11345, partial [Verrucomicrobiae bacterium]